MRQQIRDELSKIDQEYKWVSIRSERPDEFQLSHPAEKPNEDTDEVRADPLSQERPPDEGTVTITDGQRGISYEKLFLPYLRGAKSITLYDPYIRHQYQLFNLISFCEVIAPEEGELHLVLVTGCDPGQENELLAKLEEVKNGLIRDRIVLEYRLDNTLHDRWIESDTGWRINLGRGLDIFQRPEDKFTLGFMDQTKRKCKSTTITYIKI